VRPFNAEEFCEDLQRRRNGKVEAVNLAKLTSTERAFHLAFDPNRRMQSDYEAMYV
jgi:hypothetical protein